METEQQIQKIRAFNRHYTREIGVLNDRYQNGPYSLTEMRILHELGKQEGITATALADLLAMDHGFLSRTLSGLAKRRVIKRSRSTIDKRQYNIALSVLGRKQQPKLEAEASDAVARMLEPIPAEKRAQLVSAMETIHRVLKNAASPIIYRQLQHGDAGWIVHRHGASIAREFGWNHEFEAMCAQIMADFIKHYQPAWERSWIVERDGDILGSLFLIRKDESTAQLRLLYVESTARGMGLATKLIEKSIQFARAKGYRKITLFTTSNNVGARRIYEKLGMSLAHQEAFPFAGQMQNGEHWEMVL